MIEPRTLEQLVAADPIARTQAAIVAALTPLLVGVSVVAHPGKVDISELVGKTVVNAPGIGLGWSRIRPVYLVDGSYSITVEWTAYIVAEARSIANKRVEKEVVAMAIGGRLLAILADAETSIWRPSGILPVETASPAPELKPLFTIKDLSQGTAYYTVSWSQTIADVGRSVFPQPVSRTDPDNGTINFGSEEALDWMKQWIPAEEVPENA